MNEFKKLLKDILTGIDNETYDMGRVTAILSFLTYLGIAIGNAIIGHPWSAMDFAGGVGTMALGVGAHLKLKSSTEPGTNDNK
jgi:hypothetical protein